MGGKVPKLSILDGGENPAKHESMYQQWIFDMRSLQRIYPKAQMKEVIPHSVKVVAAGIVRSLESDAQVECVLEKPETVYGIVMRLDVLLQNLYQLVQGKKKKLQLFTTQLEEAVSQIDVWFPHFISKCEVKHHWRDWLFYGMFQSLRYIICYMYDNMTICYIQPMVATHRAETEVIDSKGNATTSKAGIINDSQQTEKFKFSLNK